ncbi:hypothetical protein BOQ62_00525, partial [Chryseobacterium sp. CH21]
FDGAVWQKLANGAAAEPWNVEGTTNPATANSENIYQTGNVYVTAAAVPTTTKTVNITTGGYYYFDGAVWQKLANGAAAEPWNVEGTTNPATANSEN